MQFLKQCKTCEFNFSGICAGHGNTYKYGDTITDDSLSCDDWGANLNYFTEITTCAPWYIREQYQDHRIDYPTFVELLDADSAGKAIKVNIFDAIKRIYGLSLVDLAVILNVSFGVMYRARSVGTPAKRLKNFSQTLCIPAEFFSETTTHDFPKIEQCKIEFEKQTDVNTALKVCPEWKTELARQVQKLLQPGQARLLKAHHQGPVPAIGEVQLPGQRLHPAAALHVEPGLHRAGGGVEPGVNNGGIGLAGAHAHVLPLLRQTDFQLPAAQLPGHGAAHRAAADDDGIVHSDLSFP